jgi:rRNA-processing protein FCF1
MHHVILDTNIYRNDPSRKKLDFQALEKLAKSNRVILHIPYIVEREFQTQQSELCKKDALKAMSGLSSLSKKELSDDILKVVNDIKASLEDSVENILLDSEHQLIKWAESINANRVPLCLDQAEKAMESYFKGNPPLKIVKSREDIPDSFLLQAIEKIVEDYGDVHLVANDKKVLEAYEGHENIVTYKDLKLFIESEIIQNDLKDLNPLENIDEIEKAIVSYEEETHDIGLHISNKIGEFILWESFNDNSIPDDNNEATISSYGEVKSIEVLSNELAHYGDGKFGIPFSLKIEVYGFYYIFKADYYMMRENNDFSLSVSDHNDHYFEVEDEFIVNVSGTAALTIDSTSFDLDDISESIINGSIEIDEVSEIKLCK